MGASETGRVSSDLSGAHSHHLYRLIIVASTVIGVTVSGVLGTANRASIRLAFGSVNGDEVAVRLGANHVLGGLGEPAVDEVTVRAVGRATGKLEGGLTGPAVREQGTEVVADRETQTRDAGHALRAPVAVLIALIHSGVARVSRLQSIGVDTIVEEQQMLQMRGASLGRECSIILVLGRVALAKPLDASVVLNLVLGLSSSVPSKVSVVLRNGNFGLVQIDVVGAESVEGDRGASTVLDQVQSGNP